MNNNNPLQFIMNMMRSGGNPEQLIAQMLQEQNNPMSANLLQLAQKGDSAGLESIARNLCQQRGIDFDKEFKAFKQQLGFK